MLKRIPLGQAALLHALRGLRRTAVVVRAILSYYQPVRLPVCRASLSYSFRIHSADLGANFRGQRRDLPAPAQVTSVRAQGLRPRGGGERSCDNERLRVAFRSYDYVGPPKLILLSQLNTWPARAPVNASLEPLRGRTHDSGAAWVATPLL